MAMTVENWDDDADFQGDFHAFAGQSVGTAHGSISSRLSVHSESLAGEEDWNVVLQPGDEQSTTNAIQSAKQAGIPLPMNIPSSALLGGTIKRLGKKKSQQKVVDDWDNDLEMPDNGSLTLKPMTTPYNNDDFDDFEDMEGSLGIRNAGKKQVASLSASAISPSLGSATAESEEDDLRGLELPDGPMDFDAILKKRRAADAELSDLSQTEPSPALEQPATMNGHKKSKLLSDENEDFLNDFELGGGDILDNKKTRMNKNVKIKSAKPPAPAAQRPATTLNFHDKPIDKPMHMRSHLPRPVSGTKPSSRLEPVFESGASQITRERRQLTTTNSQLLRAKRSMPVMGSNRQNTSINRSSQPFVPPGAASHQSPHSTAQRAMPYHLRRESDPNRQGAQSPPMRPHSRLSNAYVPDTPSRTTKQRKDVAPAALAREAASKRTVTKPARRRNFGDGSELEIFDDLPTSLSKEQKYIKDPVARGVPRPGLRQTQSRNEIRDSTKRTILDRMTTPAPPRTPASPIKGFHDGQTHTPSYLRDTAASRIARETRLANQPRPRSEGPLMPLSTNWKAQIAARDPLNSPTAQRTKAKRVQPTLIKNMGQNVAKVEKGMVYNPDKQRWEGNENTLAQFDVPPPLQTPTLSGAQPRFSYMERQLQAPASSPPRNPPALIAPVHTAHGVQVNGGMVFDPSQMKWLKLKDGRDVSGPLSPSVTDGGDEEDAFAGIEDLKDENSHMPVPGGSFGGMASPVSMSATVAGEVHEEFDLGPQFIRLQQDAEVIWRRRCEAWFPSGEPRIDDGRWRWAIRDMVGPRDDLSGL